jgi:hypothetical protein
MSLVRSQEGEFINTQRNMKILWKTYELDVNVAIRN